MNKHCVHQRWHLHLSQCCHCRPNTRGFISPTCTTQGFVTSNAAEAKEHNYYDQHPTNQFLPLEMEVFGCLHRHADVFLHNCANAIWDLKIPTLEGK